MKVEIPAALYALLQQQSALASAQQKSILMASDGPCSFRVNAPSVKPPVSNTTTSAPSNARAGFVDRLVDTSASIIESIWPSHTAPGAKVLPLKVFIQEILRRSKTSFSTLQLALFYIIRLRNQIEANSVQKAQQEIDAFLFTAAKSEPEFSLASPPLSPTCLDALKPLSFITSTTLCQTSGLPVCGRRVFLTALILASKYLQDRNYSNKAWSKISGLAVSEINANEFQFLSLVNYELFVGHQAFASWTSLLMAKTNQMQMAQQLQQAKASAPLTQPVSSFGAACVPCEPAPKERVVHAEDASSSYFAIPSPPYDLTAASSPSLGHYPSPASVGGVSTPAGSAAGLKRSLSYGEIDTVKRTRM